MTSTDSLADQNPGSFRPTAGIGLLQLRSRLLDFTRAYFRTQDLWEVETPLLSRDIVVDAYLEPFTTWAEASSECRPASWACELFLQTSPEFAMKRLLASGASSIFQITRAFRRGEIGRLHNPEFTILEWYHVGASYQDEMGFVEKFVCAFFDAADGLIAGQPTRPTTASEERARRLLPRPFPCSSYDALFHLVLGTGV